MKVISSVYFKDFARYFLFLEEVIKKSTKSEVDFTYISFYPCGTRYLKKAGVSQYLSASSIGNGVKGRFDYNKDYELARELSSFNITAMGLYGRNESCRLIKRAIDYLNFLDAMFENGDFDIFISSGDTRLLPKAMIYIANEHKVPVLYFEQGPFGTTTFDVKGVNAYSSFSPSFPELKPHERESIQDRIFSHGSAKKQNYWKTVKRPLKEKIFDWATLLYLYPPKPARKLIPIDLQIGLSFSQFMKSQYKSKELKFGNDISCKASLPEHFILIVLQVPVDAQLIEHSPYFNDFLSMISEVFSSLPDGYQLIVREHPQYLGRYEKNIYDYMHANNIHTANFIGLHEVIKESSLVVVNNSTVGVEALAAGKNVVTLGESFYSNKGITYDFNPSVPLREKISEALNDEFQCQKVMSFFYELVFEYLFNGHFQDYDMEIEEVRLLEFLKNNYPEAFDA